MLLIDVMIVVVALPSISRDLNSSFSDTQWTIDAYSLSLAGLLLPMGSLADILGRRRLFAIGLVAFTAGSLLCGIADTGVELIWFRVLQGIGGAAVFAIGLALLAQTFHGRELGTALGVWGGVSTLALGCGPVLGGLLTELSWRWIFYVNIPIGLAATAMTLIGVQEFRPPHARRVDILGASIFTLGLVALIYALIESSAGWASGRVVAALSIAVVALGSFPLIERLQRQPMFELSLLRKPTFVGGLAAAAGMNGSLYAVILYLVLYLQNGLHYSALGTGVRLVVITGGAMLTSIPAGRMSQHLPTRWLIGTGLALVGAGLLLMRGLHADTAWTHLVLGFAVAGAGSGLVNPPLASTAVGVVAPHNAGMASGVNSTFRMIGIATSVAVLGSIFASKTEGATTTTMTAHYASALDAVLLVAACIAFAAAALALALIHPRDFHAAGTAADPASDDIAADRSREKDVTQST